jgi:hypothetical protein
MTLKDRIAGDLKDAMRNKDEVRRDVLRMVKTEMTNREIELGRELGQDEEMAVLNKAVKSRQETVDQYEQGGQGDAAQRERQEMAVLKEYLPRTLTEEETRSAVEGLADELGLSGKKDMGALMKELNKRHAGAVDGKVASRIASEVLSNR